MQARMFIEEVSNTILEIIYNKVAFLLSEEKALFGYDNQTGP